MGGKIKLYTVQPLCVYHQLMENKVFIADPVQSSFYHPNNEEDSKFVSAYDWLMKEMKDRLSPKPKDAVIPIWGWYKYANEFKLDLRKYGKVKKPYVVMEIYKDEKEVLLSDFLAWHTILNDYYLADDELSDAEMEIVCESYDELVIHHPKKARKIKLESWKNVFKLEPTPTVSKEYIQGTFWTLHLDEVRKVRKYT